MVNMFVSFYTQVLQLLNNRGNLCSFCIQIYVNINSVHEDSCTKTGVWFWRRNNWNTNKCKIIRVRGVKYSQN